MAGNAKADFTLLEKAQNTAAVTFDEDGKSVANSTWTWTGEENLPEAAYWAGKAGGPIGMPLPVDEAIWSRYMDGLIEYWRDAKNLYTSEVKEPAVEWCEGVGHSKFEAQRTSFGAAGVLVYEREICGLSSGDVIWRKKTKGD